MIWINLLKPRVPSSATPNEAKRRVTGLVSRREPVLGAILLLGGAGLLFYLANRPQSPQPARLEPPKVTPAVAPDPPKPDPPEPASSALPSHPPAPACIVTEISVSRQTGSVSVFIDAVRSVKYKSFLLDEPDRIVIDMSGCRGTVPSQNVGDPLLQRVRSKQFQTDPDVFRVVLDVPSKPRYEIVPASKGLEIRVLDGKL